LCIFRLLHNFKFNPTVQYYSKTDTLEELFSTRVLLYLIIVDDTATLLYFEEGLAPAIGRWSLYLLNKV